MTNSSKMRWHQRLFLDRGILPTKRTIYLFLFLLLPIFLSTFIHTGWTWFITLNFILFVMSFIDLLRLPRKSQLSCKRMVEEELERGHDVSIRLEITNSSKLPIFFRLIDDLPHSFLQPFPIYGRVDKERVVNLQYQTTASIRGDYHMSKVYFRYKSALGLWERQIAFSVRNVVRVLPDMSQVRAYLTSPQTMLLHEGNKIRKHRIGSGEFNQIRPYVIGDDPRKINWRQTAKLTDVMTNVYEPEHGKYITILIDSSRMMGVELTEGNRLERSLEAALTLAAVALSKGDYVSIVAFSNRVKKYIPPGKGMAHLHTIVSGFYNLKHDSVESDYPGVFDFIDSVQKRRSFIVLFSDLDHFLFEDTLRFYIQRMRRKHLFLFIGIADPLINDWAKALPENTKLAMTKTVAQRHILQRKKEMRKWARNGIEAMEVPDDQLVVQALTHYFQIINRGLL